MEEKLIKLQNDFKNKINSTSSLKQLDEVFLELFGKSGVITYLTKEFPKIPKKELPKVGPLFNQIKLTLEKGIGDKRQEIREEFYQTLKKEELLLEIASSMTPRNDGGNSEQKKGHLHPLTQFERQIVEIFSKLGFQQFEAPYIESDYNNFEVLNIPENHPARDLWDTLYIDTAHNRLSGEGQNQEKHGSWTWFGGTHHKRQDDRKKGNKLLLRTHTSNSQIRIMKEFKPPIRMMNIGSCFRYENVDARHEHTFDQFEIVYIDKGLSMANLQYLSEHFFKAIYGPEVKVRMRPKYYPFVEPGAGVDALCMFCKGKGCKICGGVGWFELAGAGMIHPNVLKNGGIDPEVYSGIAWGVGPGRMVMLKNNIEDVRLFNSGDLRFLEKY